MNETRDTTRGVMMKSDERKEGKRAVMKTDVLSSSRQQPIHQFSLFPVVSPPVPGVCVEAGTRCTSQTLLDLSEVTDVSLTGHLCQNVTN